MKISFPIKSNVVSVAPGVASTIDSYRSISTLFMLLSVGILTAAETPVRKISQGEHCVHYYVQQNPESPDGTRVVYSSLKKADKATDVFVCARDGSAQVKIGRVAGFEAHNGANAIWIDNETVAFSEGEAEVYLVHLPDLKVRTFTGSIDEYSPANGKIIFCVRANEKLDAGIYALDVKTGERTCLVTMASMERFAPAMNRPFDPKLWHFSHPCWSPDGKRIIFEIKAGAKSTNKDDYLLHAKADGRDVTLIGLKPMHPHWWDNETVFGHDWQQKNDKHFRRWGLDGKVIDELAGAGCHGAVSADRQWIVTESWYGADPINLRLLRRGQVEPVATLYSQKRKVRGRDFWGVRSHVHPAFSADGKRVYFNAWPEDEPGPQVFCCDVSKLVGGKDGHSSP